MSRPSMLGTSWWVRLFWPECDCEQLRAELEHTRLMWKRAAADVARLEDQANESAAQMSATCADLQTATHIAETRRRKLDRLRARIAELEANASDRSAP